MGPTYGVHLLSYDTFGKMWQRFAIQGCKVPNASFKNAIFTTTKFVLFVVTIRGSIASGADWDAHIVTDAPEFCLIVTRR